MDHSYLKIFRIYWKFIRSNRRKVFAVILLLIISSVFALYPAYAFSEIINYLTNYSLGQSVTPVYWILLFLLLSVLVTIVTGFLGKNIGIRIAESASLEMEINSIKHLSLLDMSWHEKENTGNKLKRISKGSRAMNDITRVILYTFIDAVVVSIGAIWIISSFKLSLAIFVVLYLLVYYFVATILRKKAIKAMQAVNIKEEELSGLWHEIVSNIRSIKVLGMSIKIFNYSRKLISELNILVGRRVTLFQSGYSAQRIIAEVSRVLFLSYIVWGISQGNFEVGFLVLFYGYFNSLTSTIGRITETAQEMAMSKVNMGRLINILDEPVVIDKEEGKQKFPAEWESILIKDLSFSYGEQKVLSGIDLEIKKGEKVGLVGLSGAGKSTLFKLLLKEHESYCGEILIGDVPLKDIKRKYYIEHIAAVLQDTEVFNMTLKENIVLANHRMEEDKTLLNRSMAIAHINDFLPKLQDGVDTMIGEKGVKLSGGERQRLGIARAVFKEPEILFLDEATSHLDVESEQKIQDSLKKFFKDVTAVVIAHRLSTIKEMDKIVVIEGGKIIEMGTFDELSKKSGRFREFWDKQSGLIS